MQHLSALDALLLELDQPTEPRQVATLMVLEPGHPPLDHDSLISLIEDRIALIPRYRQVPKAAPFGIGTAVWVDDDQFDLALHVRRSALPAPGDRAALNDLVGRLAVRRLDPDRPLWELYIIEGLAGGGIALLFKSHQALVDGSTTVDLAQVLLDETAELRAVPDESWIPHSVPSGLDLAIEAIVDQVRSPHRFRESVRFHVDRISSTVATLRRQRQPGPLLGQLSRHRRYATVKLDLNELRKVRDDHGGTVNDVIIASVAGGLRGWMLTRAERLSNSDSFRALLPLSVTDSSPGSDALPTFHGTRVVGHMLPLPVGEPNAIVRLHQVSYVLKGHKETGSAVAANRLAGLSGFATSSYHAVAARVAETKSAHGYQLVVTNVPGPQTPLYLAGQRVREIYPVVPLSASRLLSIGVNSYEGSVYIGMVGDRDQLADLDVLGQCILDAVEELTELSSALGRAPRGRNAT